MNPIIYFDELDKISKTEHGNEISSVLTHITDPVQNEHFTDRYFSEVKIDLSKCIIVFSYNDSSKIDRILHDRIQEVKVNAIQLNEKIEICKRFIIPDILKELGYNENDVIYDDACNSGIDIRPELDEDGRVIGAKIINRGSVRTTPNLQINSDTGFGAVLIPILGFDTIKPVEKEPNSKLVKKVILCAEDHVK